MDTQDTNTTPADAGRPQRCAAQYWDTLDYDDKTNDQLRWECEDRGLETHGYRMDLLYRLCLDDWAKRDANHTPVDAGRPMSVLGKPSDIDLTQLDEAACLSRKGNDTEEVTSEAVWRARMRDLPILVSNGRLYAVTALGVQGMYDPQASEGWYAY